MTDHTHVSRHDVLLSLLPWPVVLGVVAWWATAVPLWQSLIAGSRLATVLVGYALFLNPPVER